VTDPRIGTTLDGRYQIMDALAAGGMGVVYRGERLGLGRSVAIKFLHAHMAADSSFLKRFAIEAKAMARLQHPHCAAVIDFGVAGQEPYVVMDLVSGESLRSLLDRGRLPAWRALGITRQILSGLAHAHSQGITHRDIKPDNVMVDATGSFGDQVRILDFGLAKLREGTSGLTTGFVVGTPSYMAPEQTLAQPVDERTDIYACGVLLFEMLTGEKPFQADEAVEVLRMHRQSPPPRLIDKAPDLRFSDELEAAVLQAMAKDPAHRFSTAAAFATALEHVPEASTRSTGALAAASAKTPPPELVAAPVARGGLGTAPTEWSHQHQHQPQHQQAGAAKPAAQPQATEHLGMSDLQPMSSQMGPARSSADQLGSAQLRAFAAELAASQPAQPLSSATAPQAHAPGRAPQAHGVAATVPGRVLTPPQSEAPATRADTGFTSARADTGVHGARPETGYPGARPDSVVSRAGPDSGSLAPFTDPSIASPEHVQAARKRKLWLIGGAAAGVVALLVIVGMLGDGDAADPATDEAVAEETAETDDSKELVVEVDREPEQAGEEGVEIEEDGAEDPMPVEEGSDEPGEPGEADPARGDVKAANQAGSGVIEQARAYLAAGQAGSARRLLVRMRRYERQNPEFHYLLGKAYFEDLWVQDGIDSFRDAIALDPSYRNNADLIASAARGLGNDSHHFAVARFLVRDIGAPARPALEGIATRHYREEVRARAHRALSQLAP
jgi:hypothetical protein